MKAKTQEILFGIFCLFIWCYFMRLFDFPNELTVIVGGMLCFVLVMMQKKLRIDIGICLLTVTMVSYYVIINGIRGLTFSIIYIPLIIYLLGNYITCGLEDRKDREQKILLLIIIMVAGYTIHGILNAYMWYAGYAVPGTRRWPDFWSNVITPGTLHAAFFLPVMALFLPAVLYLKKRKVINTIVILLTFFFIYTALSTKSRTTILTFLIVVGIQLFVYVICERKMLVKQSKNKRVWIGICIFNVVIIGVIYSIKDSQIVVTFIENMSKGGGILNNIRFQAQRLALRQIFKYPMGGYLMELGGISHSHNTWLDVANAAGIIPFFAFVGYTLYTFFEMIRLISMKDVSIEKKQIILGIYVIFFLYFMVEPALDASVHLVTPWIFLNGVVHGDLSNKVKG